MIDSWNAAKLNERITQVEKKIQANDVIANPTGAATEDLSKISIDGTVYGTSVVKANPVGEATEVLEEISINGVVYSLSTSKEVLWNNTSPTSSLSGVSDIDVSDYNNIEIYYRLTNSIPCEKKIVLSKEEISNVTLDTYVNASVPGADKWAISVYSRLLSISSEGVLSIGACTQQKVDTGVYSSTTNNFYMIITKILAY